MSAAVRPSASGRFHIVSVGWNSQMITGILDAVESATNITFSHLITSEPDVTNESGREGHGPFIRVRERADIELPAIDHELLRSLEGPGIPTIHNMITGDTILRALPHDEALAFATFLARRLRELFEQLKPSVVLGGFDRLHAGLGLAVARQMGIPWVAMFFTTIPTGFVSFCTSTTPEQVLPFDPPPEPVLRALVEKTLRDFEAKSIIVPAYISSGSLSLVLKRLPRHLRLFWGALKRTLVGGFDRYTELPAWRLALQYLRKRRNAIRLPLDWFVQKPPTTPYIFFGLHMRPESTVDIWAPFYTNQFYVLEILARAMPPSHQLLVKLHKSDSDNYSRAELKALRRLPGLKLVSPFVQSRDFIEHASIVASIQGTMAFEAALLAKPVLVFGASKTLDMPGVKRAMEPSMLPAQIRELLEESRPTREEILRGFMTYLAPCSPGCYADWEAMPTPAEVADLARLFERLRDFYSKSAAAGLPA